MGKINRLVLVFLPMFLLISMLGIRYAFASCAIDQQSCSTTYGVGNYIFGSGGSLDTTCSTTYCAAQTLGETGAGVTGSATYQSYPGFEVNREPSLQFVVNAATINLGNLSTSTPEYGVGTFNVKTYLSSGYIIQTISPAPQNGTHTMASPSSPVASAVGTEQFGINLVQNLTTCPTPAPFNFGANPVQVPSASYSYGAATANYGTCGKFMYHNGDTIASSTQSSGETDYTISYIANISSVTPAGLYNMNQVLVAIPTF